MSRKRPRFVRGAATVLVALLGMSAPAAAVTVDAHTSAIFAFDVFGLGSFQIDGFEYRCSEMAGDPCSQTLAAGASFIIDVGSAAAGADVGSRTVSHPFTADIAGLSGDLPMWRMDGAETPTLFASMRFVDDVFDARRLRLFLFLEPTTGLGSFTRVNGSLVSPAPVPLPGAAWLMLASVGGLVLLKRRRATT